MTEEVNDIPGQEAAVTSEPADEQVETSEAEATAADGNDSTAEHDEPKKAKGVQKRIDELTRQRREVERDRDYWREMAARQKPEAPNHEPEPSVTGEPQLEQFEDYDEYLVAKAEHRIEQKIQRQHADQQQRQELQTKQQKAQAFAMKAQAAREKYEDFDLVALNPSTPITEAMETVILDSEIGDDLAYYLGSNPDSARQISQLSPLAAASELGKIEAKLSQPPPPSTTKAPDPIKPLSGNESVTTSPENMSIDEWMTWRNKQVRG